MTSRSVIQGLDNDTRAVNVNDAKPKARSVLIEIVSPLFEHELKYAGLHKVGKAG